jgi:CubicO group peptidase (beta-lactamase class C family)
MDPGRVGSGTEAPPPISRAPSEMQQQHTPEPPVDRNGNRASALQRMVRTTAVLREQMDEKNWHSAAMVSVRLDGQPQLDIAVGEIRPTVPMNGEAMMNWMSTTKAVAVVAIGQLMEKGKLHVSDRVSQHIPEVPPPL